MEASVTRMTYTPVDEVDAYGFMYSGEVSLSLDREHHGGHGLF